MLNIVSITKDDWEGISRTIESTRLLREHDGVHQIIADSSKEDLADRIRSLVSQEARIEYHWQEPSGRAAAFNLGLHMCNEGWVWFLNGGDQAHPDLDIPFFFHLLTRCSAGAIIFDVEHAGTGTKSVRPPLWKLWPPLYYNWVPHQGALVQKSLITEINGFNENFVLADIDLWIRLFSPGSRCAPDLVSIPVAVYACGGISESIGVTAKEVRQIMRRNWKVLLKRTLQNVSLLPRIWLYLTYRRFLNLSTQQP